MLSSHTACENVWRLGHLPVWRSSNALVSVNVVTLRQARLMPGWVTVLGWVNHLGTEPDTQAYSA